MREEVAALVGCMSSSGLLSQERLWAEAHRRRFAAALRSAPCQWEVAIQDTIGVPLLASALLDYGGLYAVLRLRAASVALRRAVPATAIRASTSVRLFLCGGESNGQHLSSVECLAQSRQWEALPSMREGRSWAAAAALGGEIYVCGGTDGVRVLNSVERFCPGAGTWSPAPPMLERREGGAATCGAANASEESCLIVCGGGDGDSILRSAECFDLAKGVWTSLRAMFSRRLGIATAAMDGSVYVCGGNDGHWSLSSAERLDLSIGVWEPLPDMSQRRERFAAAAMEGYLYVCGGGDHPQVLASAERFNPTTCVWEGLAPMPRPRHAVAASSICGRLLVCGGSYGRQDLRTVERFNPMAGAWEPMPVLLEPRNSAAAATLRC